MTLPNLVASENKHLRIECSSMILTKLHLAICRTCPTGKNETRRFLCVFLPIVQTKARTSRVRRCIIVKVRVMSDGNRWFSVPISLLLQVLPPVLMSAMNLQEPGSSVLP